MNYFTYQSTDGGLTWNIYPIYMIGVSNVLRISPSTLMYYGGDPYYLSNDNGQTITKYLWPGGFYLQRVGLLPGGNLYGLQNQRYDGFGSIADMYISADNGQSWQKKNTSSFYASVVKMYDNNNGIAYSGGILQTTNDGGATWSLKLFPIH
jgi:hypothetical protein